MLIRKRKKLDGERLSKVLELSCRNRTPIQISTSTLKFTSRFIAVQGEFLMIDNTLNTLDDVRALRNRDLVIFFPYRNTLYRGTIRLLGLSTVQNMRVLQVTSPPELVTDEKRDSRRIKSIPPGSSLTFSTMDLRLFRARIVNVSLRGMALIIMDRVADQDIRLKKGTQIQADASLGDFLKLSFEAEVRYVNDLTGTATPGSLQIGIRIRNLSEEASTQLNEWIFKVISEEREQHLAEEPLAQDGGKVLTKTRTVIPNSILVVSPLPDDLEFWHQCLGRKYELITSDMNITNIRLALSTGPSLILMYLDPVNSAKASFTRKLCGSLAGTALMFFGEEADPNRQKTLMGTVPNHGFLDTGERKILVKFRQVDEVMKAINTSGTR